MTPVTIDAEGGVDSTELTAGLLQIFSDFWTLDELEGLALDRAGLLYTEGDDDVLVLTPAVSDLPAAMSSAPVRALPTQW